MNSYFDFSVFSNTPTSSVRNNGFEHMEENSKCYQPSLHFPTEYNETRNVVPPMRRWSHGDSQQASIETTASDYHNPGFVLHNNISMSNHRYTSSYDSNPNSSFFPLTSSGEETQLPSYSFTQVQDLQSFSHNFYETPLPHLNYYANEQRPLTAPEMNAQALHSLPNHSIPTGCTGRRRFRTNFTEQQSLFLEDSFKESHYPDHKTKKQMSETLCIPEDRITVWFQNRRAKWRRKEQRHKNRNKHESQNDESTMEFSPPGDEIFDGVTNQSDALKVYQMHDQGRPFHVKSRNCP